MKKDELTCGEVRAMYFDDDALQLPSEPLFRLDVKGERNYFKVVDGEPVFFAGVTTVAGKALPKGEYLTKWIADKGYDAAMAYRDERAAYGTLLHTLIAELLIKRAIDLDTIEAVTFAYMEREQLTGYKVAAWASDLKQDLLAFAQFMYEHDVRPLAIEVSLASSAWGIAGTCDLPCELTIKENGYWGEVYASGKNKGEPKVTKKDVRIRAMVDIKSGRKSYGGDEYAAAQLAMYSILWNENFPDGEPLLRCFNWSPKDWVTVPSYHFTEQTNSFTVKQVELMLDFYQSRVDSIGHRTKTFYKGLLTIDAGINENFAVHTMRDLAIERLENDAPKVGELEQLGYLTYDELLAIAKTYDESAF